MQYEKQSNTQCVLHIDSWTWAKFDVSWRMKFLICILCFTVFWSGFHHLYGFNVVLYNFHFVFSIFHFLLLFCFCVFLLSLPFHSWSRFSMQQNSSIHKEYTSKPIVEMLLLFCIVTKMWISLFYSIFEPKSMFFCFVFFFFYLNCETEWVRETMGKIRLGILCIQMCVVAGAGCFAIVE